MSRLLPWLIPAHSHCNLQAPSGESELPVNDSHLPPPAAALATVCGTRSKNAKQNEATVALAKRRGNKRRNRFICPDGCDVLRLLPGEPNS
jgi:hypothetical protein